MWTNIGTAICIIAVVNNFCHAAIFEAQSKKLESVQAFQFVIFWLVVLGLIR